MNLSSVNFVSFETTFKPKGEYDVSRVVGFEES